jgi:hypothetical protein
LRGGALWRHEQQPEQARQRCEESGHGRRSIGPLTAVTFPIRGGVPTVAAYAAGFKGLDRGSFARSAGTFPCEWYAFFLRSKVSVPVPTV